MSRPRLGALASALAILSLSAPASAQDEPQGVPPDPAEPAEPAPDYLSADHPGFSDASATVAPRAFQLELGADAAGADPFALTASALVRYGVHDWVEARLEMPGLGFGFPGGGDIQTSLNSIEVGAKLRWMISDRLQLGFLPYLIAPSGTETTPLRGPGGGLGVIADVAMGDALGVTASVVPRMVGYKSGETDRQYDFELDGALGLGWALRERLSLFVEAWASMDGEQSITPAANGGVIWYLNPDILFDAYVGVQLPGGSAVPYGGLGFVCRLGR